MQAAVCGQQVPTHTAGAAGWGFRYDEGCPAGSTARLGCPTLHLHPIPTCVLASIQLRPHTYTPWRRTSTALASGYLPQPEQRGREPGPQAEHNMSYNSRQHDTAHGCTCFLSLIDPPWQTIDRPAALRSPLDGVPQAVGQLALAGRVLNDGHRVHAVEALGASMRGGGSNWLKGCACGTAL